MGISMGGVRRFMNPASRSLMYQLVITNFKLRYQGSALGYVWSVLKPIMLFSVLYFVFTVFIPVGREIEYFPSYLMLGLVLWTFFVEATVSGLNSISGRGDLIRKVNVPKSAIVVSAVLSAAINFAINMMVVLIVFLLNGVPLRFSMLVGILPIVELFVFAIAISFILASLYIRFRDFGHIWDVVLQVLFYATPIIYLLDRIPIKYAQVTSLNPLAQIIQDARYFIVTKNTATPSSVYGSIIAGRVAHIIFVIAVCFIAVWYFRKSSKYLAEEL